MYKRRRASATLRRLSTAHGEGCAWLHGKCSPLLFCCWPPRRHTYMIYIVCALCGGVPVCVCSCVCVTVLRKQYNGAKVAHRTEPLPRVGGALLHRDDDEIWSAAADVLAKLAHTHIYMCVWTTEKCVCTCVHTLKVLSKVWIECHWTGKSANYLISLILNIVSFIWIVADLFCLF